MAINHSLGKLSLALPLRGIVDAGVRCGNAVLAVDAEHTLAVADLACHHDDPFDRLLIAQGRTEGLRLVTRDAAFEPYEVQTLCRAATLAPHPTVKAGVAPRGRLSLSPYGWRLGGRDAARAGRRALGTTRVCAWQCEGLRLPLPGDCAQGCPPARHGVVRTASSAAPAGAGRAPTDLCGASGAALKRRSQGAKPRASDVAR